MKTLIRLVIAACAALTLFAFAGPAAAAYGPRLIATSLNNASGRPTAMLLGHVQGGADEATAKDTIYVPLGYGVTLNQPAGTKIGDVEGTVVLRGAGNAEVDITGVVRAENPQTYLDPARNRCDRPAPVLHEAVWLINATLRGTGTTIPVPVYVDRTTGAEAAFASAKIQICFAGPAGTPSGAQLLVALFDVNGVFRNPSARGYRVWRAAFTPYVPGTAEANPAGTVEGQAHVPSSVALTIRARSLRRGGVLINGRLLVQGAPLSGASIELYVGNRRVGRARTNRTGRFTIRLKRIKSKTRYRALVTRVDDRPSGCTVAAPPIAPAGCQTATLSFIAVSNPVTARPRR